MIDFDVGVILPSAGSGDRLGGSTPKQYCMIMGRPLFLYALQEFLALPWVKKIALVVDNPDNVCGFLEESCSEKDKLIIVQGEHTRHRSIRAGVQEILKNDPNLRVIVVHDAVRPFVPVGFLEELVLAAKEHGAAGAIRPLISTVVKHDENGFLEKCLDRSEYVASETPQAFQSDVLSKAYRHCSEEELEKGTECLQLALAHAGVAARLITGPSDLWKVTYKKDLYAATCCIRERERRACVVAAEDSAAVRLLEEALGRGASAVRRVPAADAVPPGAFNVIVLFHSRDVDPDRQLLDLDAVLDGNKEALVVHVTEGEGEGAGGGGGGREGVVAVRGAAPGGERGRRLAALVEALLASAQAPAHAHASPFAGQTFLL